MFDYLIGEIKKVNLGKSSVTLENGDIGYRIFLHSRDLTRIPASQRKQKLFLYFRVKEDLQEFYGFLEESEREIFELVIGISGVGPKMGIAILSTFNEEELQNIVSNNDVNSLTSISGVGKRTAEKMMLDLKAKMSIVAASSTTSISSNVAEALEQLGYTQKEIQNAILSVDTDSNEFSNLSDMKRDKLFIKKALVYFNRK